MEKKKLALKKETLRHLETTALQLAAGGVIHIHSFKHSCAGCESEDPACTLPFTACLASCSC